MSTMIRFGTDGWQARLGEGFTEENLIRVADAAGKYWSQQASGAIVYVGYDTRPDADRFAQLAARVLAGYGLVAKVSDRYVPTPALSWTVTNDQRSCGGFMVTGSHFPYDYLGVRLYTADGAAATPHMLEEVEERIDAEPSDVRGAVQFTDFATAYLDALCASVDGNAIAAAHLTVVYDPLYGAGHAYLPDVLRALGVEVVEIHGDMDDDAHDLHPEPIEPWVDGCERAVTEHGASAGLVTDGDGDRIGAVDGMGRLIPVHKIIALVLEHLVSRRGQTGRVVLNVSASTLVRRVAAALSCRVAVKPTGYAQLYKEMLKGDVILGADEAGDISVPSHMLERDGLYIALLLCEIIAMTGKTLAELSDELDAHYGAWSYGRRDLRVENEVIESFKTLLPGLNPQTIASKTPQRVSHMDGLRLEFDDESWLLMRPSRMTPVVRVYAEAPTVQARDQLLEAGCDLARGEGA